MNDRSAVLPVKFGWRERAGSILTALERFPLWAFQLLFRLCVGGVFWSSGLTKIASWQTTVALFRDEYKVPLLPPELAATLAASVELSTPVLLVIGLGTRLATLPMLAMTFVIEVLVYPEDWNEHLIWTSMLLFILTRGPGLISLDHLIAKYLLGRTTA
ncbi:MAG TPA: DoxX family protein [Alphaproteobacteria bacterium]|nr:DoxX family protein [Alphaproteobacteria bacterium]